MTRIVRGAVAAALVAAPLALAAPPAHAACHILPVGQAEVTFCADRGWTCGYVDTLNPDAYACVGPDGAYTCGIRLFRLEAVCA